MRLEITQDHIDRSTWGRHTLTPSTECPVALALRDHYPDAEVGHNDYWIGTNLYSMTEPLTTYVEQFDNYGPTCIRPASFELESIR